MSCPRSPFALRGAGSGVLLTAALAATVALHGCGDPGSHPVEPAFDAQTNRAPAATAQAHQRSARVPGPRNFVAPLEGAQEVPPVETRARGMTHFQLSADGTEISYRLIVANILDVAMAHIHVAPVGANGPVVVWLYPDAPPPQLIEGRTDGVLATGTFTADDLVGPLAGAELADLVDVLRDGGAYVNVHTSEFPGGEVRGQIAVAGPR